MENREPVRLILDGTGFAEGMRRARAAARTLSALLAAQQATWEPHDWSDFD